MIIEDKQDPKDVVHPWPVQVLSGRLAYITASDQAHSQCLFLSWGFRAEFSDQTLGPFIFSFLTGQPGAEAAALLG